MNSSIRPTRFKELGYRHDSERNWRIVDIMDGGESSIGPYYVTKAELLADLERFAEVFGCNMFQGLIKSIHPAGTCEGQGGK